MIMSRLLTVVLMSLWVTSILESLLDLKAMNEHYIGSFLLGKQTIYDSPYEQNSDHLLAFLVENDSFLPQTFFDLHSKYKITYLEISAEDGYNTFAPKPVDFSTLDFVVAPSQVKISLNTLNLTLTFLFHLDTTHL